MAVRAARRCGANGWSALASRSATSSGACCATPSGVTGTGSSSAGKMPMAPISTSSSAFGSTSGHQGPVAATHRVIASCASSPDRPSGCRSSSSVRVAAPSTRPTWSGSSAASRSAAVRKAAASAARAPSTAAVARLASSRTTGGYAGALTAPSAGVGLVGGGAPQVTDVVAVDDAVGVALLGQEPLPVGGEVLVHGVARGDGVEARGAPVGLGPQHPAEPLCLLLARAERARHLDRDRRLGQVDGEVRDLGHDQQVDLAGPERVEELLALLDRRLTLDDRRVQPLAQLVELVDVLPDDQHLLAAVVLD